MPELPEVTTIVNDLNKELVGLAVVDVKASSIAKDKLVGKRVKRVMRSGKMIVFDFSGLFLLIHLKMTGRLIVKSVSAPPLRWERAQILFSRGKSLRFEDLRMFGYMKLVNKEELETALAKLGEDALTISEREFYQQISNRRVAIKKLLLDQKVLSGVGNIYASEALFEAKISPFKLGNELSRRESDNLLKGIKKVLKKGINARGATLSDDMYRDAYGKRGLYEKHVLVYGRAGKDCFNKCGSKVEREQLGGRGTFFCPKCQ
jgi:formamidopyrimidine-DNA glycosylase